MKDEKSDQPQDSQTHQPANESFDSDDTFRKNTVFLSFFGTGVIYFLCWAGLKDKPEYFWQVFVTGTLSYLIFLAMFVQSRVSKKQWRVMQDGLERTDRLLEQNERMIDAVNTQATHAENQANTMTAQLLGTKIQLRQMVEQTSAMERQADMMRETLTQTKEHFWIDNSPVLIVTDARLEKPFRDFISMWSRNPDFKTNPLTATITMTNTGKSVANDVNIRFWRKFLQGEDAEKMRNGERPATNSKLIHKGIVGPGQSIEFTTDPIFWNEDINTKIINPLLGPFVFYVWGHVQYADLRKDGDTHITFFNLYIDNTDRTNLAYNPHGNLIGKMGKPDLSRLFRMPDGPDWGKPIVKNSADDEKDGQNPN